MIAIDDARLTFSYMGLFEGTAGWIHPKAAVPTYELIYVTEGRVYIEEAGARYPLSKGELLLLDKGVGHAGYAQSCGDVSFYWLHFDCDGLGALGVPKRCRPPDEQAALLFFRQTAHLSATGKTAAVEIELLRFLYRLGETGESSDKTSADAAEWIRLYAALPLTARAVSDQFGYNADYLSRLFKRRYGVGLTGYIAMRRCDLVKNYLLSTNLSVKEIADKTGFSEPNRLTKFFKEREGETPTAFRDRYFGLHKNIE